MNAARCVPRAPAIALDEIDLGSWEFWRRDDEYRDSAFATLRKSPIQFYSELTRPGEVAGDGHWALTRHEHIRFASRHPEIFSSTPWITIVDPPEPIARYFQSMLTLDGPAHQRLRALVSRAFTPKVVATVEGSIKLRAQTLVSAMASRHRNSEGVGEFVRDVAAPLPVQVICDMMGIPERDQSRIFDWTNVVLGFGDPEVAGEFGEFLTATESLAQYGLELAESRRSSGGNDLTSSLVNAEIDGERLTAQEIAAFFILLVGAGIETTRNALAHGLVALTRFQDQRQLWWAKFEQLRQTAVEEILRWSSPLIYMRRTLKSDIELAGVTMFAGQKITMWYPSANRDEAVFGEPWRFDLRRDPNPHFAFGAGGAHFCLGASLARREIAAVFEELHRQIPDIAVAGEPSPLLSAAIHGIKLLPVSW